MLANLGWFWLLMDKCVCASGRPSPNIYAGSDNYRSASWENRTARHACSMTPYGKQSTDFFGAGGGGGGTTPWRMRPALTPSLFLSEGKAR